MSANFVLAKMDELRTARTVANYLDFAYFGGMTFEQLEEENLVEVLNLIDAGELVMTKSKFKKESVR